MVVFGLMAVILLREVGIDTHVIAPKPQVSIARDSVQYKKTYLYGKRYGRLASEKVNVQLYNRHAIQNKKKKNAKIEGKNSSVGCMGSKELPTESKHQVCAACCGATGHLMTGSTAVARR